MNEEEIERLLERVEAVIQTKVNGRIESLHHKVDEHNAKHEMDMADVREHMKNVSPILEGLQGAKVIGEAMKWLAGVVAAWILFHEVFLKLFGK